jgi:hypothetical protein
MQRISRQHGNAPSIPDDDFNGLGITVAATAYRDALYLYGSGVLSWVELVLTHRELRTAIRLRRSL